MGYLEKIRKRLTGPRLAYQPLIEIRIAKQQLLANLKEYQNKFNKLKIAPVLKSNAYGHGLIQVAKIFDQQNLPFFVVDSLFEALMLRREGIKTKIVILGFTSASQIESNDLKDCSIGITNLDTLTQIAQTLKSQKYFHLKVDSGMHRQGLTPEQIDPAIKLIKSNPKILLEGLCTHFADADNENADFSIKQIEIWNKLSSRFRQEFPSISYFHAANTSGIRFSETIDANVARIGLGLYQGVLQMQSVISSIKGIKPGDKVGYNLTFEAVKPTKIATVPVGYHEGLDRGLSNKGSLKVGDIFCPIIGLISMNTCTIDVSAVPNIELNQPVSVISSSLADLNSVPSMAKIIGISQYEILVHIPASLRRIVA